MLCQRIDSNNKAHEIHRFSIKHAEQMLKPGGCLLFLREIPGGSTYTKMTEVHVGNSEKNSWVKIFPT